MACGRGASDRVVLQCRGRGAVGRELLERGVERANGGDASSGLETVGGPTVEAEAGARLLLGGGDVPMLALHSFEILILLARATSTAAAAAECLVFVVVALVVNKPTTSEK